MKHQEKVISWDGLMDTHEEGVLGPVLLYAGSSSRKMILPPFILASRVSRRVLLRLLHHLFSRMYYNHCSI